MGQQSGFPEPLSEARKVEIELLEMLEKEVWEQKQKNERYRNRISVLLGALQALSVQVDSGPCFCHPPLHFIKDEAHTPKCRRAREALKMEANLESLDEVVLTAEERERFNEGFVDKAIKEAMARIEELEGGEV